MKRDRQRLQKLTSVVLDDKSYLEIRAKDVIKSVGEISSSLDKEWIDSGYSDFSLYHRKDYLYSVINCYNTDSRGSITKALKFFKDNNIDIAQFDLFEDYNGLGFTTLDLMEAGFKSVTYFNDVEVQLEAFDKILNYCGLEKPTLAKERTGEYDIVLSLETAEHYQEPDDYMDSIMSMVKPGGWLVLAQTFNPKWLGHFPTYKIDGEIYTARKAGAENKRRIMRNGFDLHYVGFNTKPCIFKKRMDQKEGKNLII